MDHGIPNYYSTPAVDYATLPDEVIAFLVELTNQVDPVDTAPPMRGTQDSIYDAGNPAVAP